MTIMMQHPHNQQQQFLNKLQAQAKSSSVAGSSSANNNNKRDYYVGAWTDEEQAYVQALIEGFEEGTLDIPEKTSLRFFVSEKLNCKPKRVSKKYENTGYNGKQVYRRNRTMGEEELAMKRAKLKELEDKFWASRQEILKTKKASHRQGSSSSSSLPPSQQQQGWTVPSQQQQQQQQQLSQEHDIQQAVESLQKTSALEQQLIAMRRQIDQNLQMLGGARAAAGGIPVDRFRSPAPSNLMGPPPPSLSRNISLGMDFGGFSSGMGLGGGGGMDSMSSLDAGLPGSFPGPLNAGSLSRAGSLSLPRSHFGGLSGAAAAGVGMGSMNMDFMDGGAGGLPRFPGPLGGSLSRGNSITAPGGHLPREVSLASASLGGRLQRMSSISSLGGMGPPASFNDSFMPRMPAASAASASAAGGGAADPSGTPSSFFLEDLHKRRQQLEGASDPAGLADLNEEIGMPSSNANNKRSARWESELATGEPQAWNNNDNNNNNNMDGLLMEQINTKRARLALDP